MHIWKKLLAPALAAGLLAGLLAGCGAQSAPGENDTGDIIQQTAGIPGDTVVMTIDGSDITAEAYLYWVAYSADYLANYYYGATGLAWSDESLTGYLEANALDALSLYTQAALYAGEEGITLGEEEQAALEEDIQTTIDQLGGEEAYAQRLKESAVTPEGFRSLLEQFYLYSALLDRLYGPEGTEPVTEEEIASYIDENGIYRAKHILLLTKDMTTGEALDEETVAEKKALANDLLSQLRESTAPQTLFDQLMNEYSEDTGLATNPDGYTTQTGAMVSAFEDTALALDIGQISDVVESEYGYHIILRLAVDPDDYWSTVASAKLDATLYQRMDEQNVEYADAYGSLDLEAFYTALTAYRDTAAEG